MERQGKNLIFPPTQNLSLSCFSMLVTQGFLTGTVVQTYFGTVYYEWYSAY